MVLQSIVRYHIEENLEMSLAGEILENSFSARA